MQYDNLPKWKDVSVKVEAKEPLDPVEQFIYDGEPLDGGKEWRSKFQAALYFFGGAPQNKGSASLQPITQAAQNAEASTSGDPAERPVPDAVV